MATPNTHHGASAIDRMLHAVRSIYFLGIGGISMSSLAALTHRSGIRVGGYDRTVSPLTEQLAARGIPIDTQASAANIDGYDAVVYTVAISDEQPEYVEAQRRGIPLISRADYMGYLMTDYVHRIGIAGTHGKSTTTGMCAQIFLAAMSDPTVLCGAALPAMNGAYRAGKKEFMIFEACEYMDSFLDFNPTAALVLNTELDHVDYFKSMEQMCASYAAFAAKAGESGCVIYNADDPVSVEAMRTVPGRHITFGLGGTANYRAVNVQIEEGTQTFSLLCDGEHLARICLHLPGQYNLYNALAAAAAAHEHGICSRAIAEGLEVFGGVHRRMEYKGMLFGGRLYDDYAHHPSEIRAALTGARQMSAGGRVVCVFQSHTFSRTAALFDDFVSALSGADAVIVAPIYAARETNTYGVSAELLAGALRRVGTHALSGDSFEGVARLLAHTVEEGDVIVVMGAGDIEKVYPLLPIEKPTSQDADK